MHSATTTVTTMTTTAIMAASPHPTRLSHLLACRQAYSGRPHALGRLARHETEQVSGDSAHLDLVGPLGDAVAAVVTVDVLERLVPRVAAPAEDLHRLVGGVTAQAIGLVVAHRHLGRRRERTVCV